LRGLCIWPYRPTITPFERNIVLCALSPVLAWMQSFQRGIDMIHYILRLQPYGLVLDVLFLFLPTFLPIRYNTCTPRVSSTLGPDCSPKHCLTHTYDVPSICSLAELQSSANSVRPVVNFDWFHCNLFISVRPGDTFMLFTSVLPVQSDLMTPQAPSPQILASYHSHTNLRGKMWKNELCPPF
jgi:hypothetical protein